MFLFASDGAAAVEQALKVAFQYWRNQGDRDRTAFLALGDAYHGDTVGSLSLGAGGFGTDLFDPLRFPGVIRSPGYREPGWLPAALDALSEHAPTLAAVVMEPLVQGAAGMYVTCPEDVRASVRRARTPVCSWCVTKWPQVSAVPGACLRLNNADCVLI